MNNNLVKGKPVSDIIFEKVIRPYKYEDYEDISVDGTYLIDLIDDGSYEVTNLQYEGYLPY